MKRGGQVSVEYMMVLGMAFLLLIPGGYLFYSFSQGSQDQIASSRLNRAGNQILGAVQDMYAVGQNSWTTLQINVPENVENIYVADGRELVFKYETQVGMSEAVFFSDINITGGGPGNNISEDFEPGLTKIKVQSSGQKVNITEIT